MELNHENHEKTMKIRICPQKPWKQRFLVKIFPKFSPAASNFSLNLCNNWKQFIFHQFINLILIAYVCIFVSLRYMYIKFVIKFGDASRRQSSIWTKNSLNCVQKNMKTMNLRKKITMKTMKMGKNNHENHEKLLKNGWDGWYTIIEARAYAQYPFWPHVN